MTYFLFAKVNKYKFHQKDQKFMIAMYKTSKKSQGNQQVLEN